MELGKNIGNLLRRERPQGVRGGSEPAARGHRGDQARWLGVVPLRDAQGSLDQDAHGLRCGDAAGAGAAKEANE